MTGSPPPTCGIPFPVVTPWNPIYKGIEHLSGTNHSPSGDFENLMAIQAMRIDLRDPDLRFLSTPPIDNYQVNSRETAGHTVSQFLRLHKLQVAINAGFFRPTDNYLPDGTPMTTPGLLISEGVLVSEATYAYSASLLLDSTNRARIVPTNWPVTSHEGVWTAVSGDYAVLVKGVNVGKNYRGMGGIHNVNPRTGIGLSEDGRYLYLLVIDGRQNGYSEGAYDSETAAWLKLLGAHDLRTRLDGPRVWSRFKPWHFHPGPTGSGDPPCGASEGAPAGDGLPVPCRLGPCRPAPRITHPGVSHRGESRDQPGGGADRCVAVFGGTPGGTGLDDPCLR